MTNAKSVTKAATPTKPHKAGTVPEDYKRVRGLVLAVQNTAKDFPRNAGELENYCRELSALLKKYRQSKVDVLRIDWSMDQTTTKKASTH